IRSNRLIGKSKRLVNWENYITDIDSLPKSIKDKNQKLVDYYEDQNEMIQRYINIDKFLDSGIQSLMIRHYATDLPMIQSLSSSSKVPGNIDFESNSILGYNFEEDARIIVIAILINYFINVLLLIGKIIVTILTSSISIMASLVDSFLDFLSTTIIYITNKYSKTTDWNSKNKYPIGKSRLEPIGVLVFSIIIIISFVQVGHEALDNLLFNTSKIPIEIGLASVFIMSMTIIIKIGCWAWCKSIKSSSVQALAQDAETDVVFNVFSLIMPLLGHWWDIWWFDPACALALSLYIVISWSLTALEHINNLAGAKADKNDVQEILYLVLRFADSIEKITKLNVYHVGDNLNVEVDIMLNPNFNLKDGHDIGEAVQYAVETLSNVERCFVHLDYRTGNFDGHLK
ncbi:cation diffusion facilitator family transporter ASCRUDRAFT_20416, partial [Ascoidea rubescens DSM 1968]